MLTYALRTIGLEPIFHLFTVRRISILPHPLSLSERRIWTSNFGLWAHWVTLFTLFRYPYILSPNLYTIPPWRQWELHSQPRTCNARALLFELCPHTPGVIILPTTGLEPVSILASRFKLDEFSNFSKWAITPLPFYLFIIIFILYLSLLFPKILCIY